MLLGLYLGTTAFSWAVIGLGAVAVKNYADREGYEVVKRKRSLSETILSTTSLLLKMSIPVFNFLIATVFLMQGEKGFKLSVENALKNGHLRKKESTYEEVEKATNEANKEFKVTRFNQDDEDEIVEEKVNDSINSEPYQPYSNKEYMKFFQALKETDVVPPIDEVEAKEPKLEIKLGKYKD